MARILTEHDGKEEEEEEEACCEGLACSASLQPLRDIRFAKTLKHLHFLHVPGVPRTAVLLGLLQ